MAPPARTPATYEDLLAVPRTRVAEILFGTLHTFPRPAMPHAIAAAAIGEELGPPFKRGKEGPGGWLLVDGPELHLGADVLVPDLAGWRRERLPSTLDVAAMVVAPDWVCEVPSPSTQAIDRTDKASIYAREGRPISGGSAHWLEPSKSCGSMAPPTGSRRRGGDAKVRAEPFEAFELDLAILWAR